MEYFQYMTRVVSLARRHSYELLIGALLTTALLELILGRNASPMSIRYAIPLVALLVAPLFARTRFPFAAPASYWLIATAISFVDGALIPFMVSLFPVGLVAAFLLGNQRDLRRAWAGLAIVLGGIITVVYNIPGHLTAELIVIPVDFGISWAAGLSSATVRRRRRPPRPARRRPNASARRPHESRSRRSVHGSRVSCTTSSPTR